MTCSRAEQGATALSEARSSESLLHNVIVESGFADAAFRLRLCSLAEDIMMWHVHLRNQVRHHDDRRAYTSS